MAKAPNKGGNITERRAQNTGRVDFPSGLAVKSSPSSVGGAGSVPG